MRSRPAVLDEKQIHPVNFWAMKAFFREYKISDLLERGGEIGRGDEMLNFPWIPGIGERKIREIFQSEINCSCTFQ